VLVALNKDGGKASNVVLDPTEKEVAAASSLHVFAWSSRGELVLAESEGAFEVEAWEEAAEAARKRCIGARGQGSAGDADVDMGDAGGSGEGQSLDGWLRTSVANEMAAATRWRGEV
jgi:exosome complex component RRP46